MSCPQHDFVKRKPFASLKCTGRTLQSSKSSCRLPTLTVYSCCLPTVAWTTYRQTIMGRWVVHHLNLRNAGATGVEMANVPSTAWRLPRKNSTGDRYRCGSKGNGGNKMNVWVGQWLRERASQQARKWISEWASQRMSGTLTLTLRTHALGNPFMAKGVKPALVQNSERSKAHKCWGTAAIDRWPELRLSDLQNAGSEQIFVMANPRSEMFAQASLVLRTRLPHVWSPCLRATKRHSVQKSKISAMVCATIYWMHYIPSVVLCGCATHANMIPWSIPMDIRWGYNPSP